MRRLKLFFACLLMAVLSIGQVWAETVEFTPSNTTSWNSTQGSQSQTLSGITFSSNNAANNTQLRLYSGGTHTFTSTVGNITSIVFTCTANGTANYGPGKLSGTGYTASSGKTGEWTGSAAEVTISGGQARCTSILVTYTPSGDPTVALTPTSLNLDAENVENQSVAISTSNFTSAISSVTTGLYSDESCETEITSGKWVKDITVNSDKTAVTFNVDDNNTGVVRECWMKVTASNGTKSAFEVLHISQKKIVVDYATLPFEFTGGRADIENTDGMTQSGLGTDYANVTTKLKFDGSGDYVIIHFNAAPGILSYDIKGNSFSGGTFKIQESADGQTYTDKASYTEDGTGIEVVLSPTVRYVKFVYVTKSSGNIGLGNISILEPVDVAKPTISGETPFLNTTTVTLTQADADAIYYTTNGVDPTIDNNLLYSNPFTLDANKTVKAIAVKGGVSSSVAEKAFSKIETKTVAQAIAAIPNQDDVVNNQYVEGFVCTAGTSVNNSGQMTYYISDDGSETARLQIYLGKNLNNTAFAAANDLALGDKVIVYGQLKNYKGTKEMNSGNYLVSKVAAAVAAPIFSPNGGGFMGETDVTITCATEGSDIYYTLNGTTPTKLSTPYTAAIHLDATTTITAVAYVGDDASLVIAKTFTLTAPMTVAEALTALDTESPINNVAVAGIISTAPEYNPSSGKLTYYISDDGSASDELEVYKGFGVAGASFSDKADLQVGDEVTVFGNLTIYNTTKEFAEGSRLLAFNRPAKPTITADPEAVANVAAEGGTDDITLTYENITNYISEVTLHPNSDGTGTFEGDWLEAEIDDSDYGTITYLVSANDGEARTAYIKVYAIGDDDKEATLIIPVSQEAYVAPALPASLPFAFDGGRNDIESTQGMSQEGLDSDYGSSPKLKFNSTGDVVIINIADVPGKLTYDIKGNGFSGSTFTVQESEDGVAYTDVATYTELGATQHESYDLDQDTRYVKFIYTEKVTNGGNVALGNIAIAEYVAPAPVETPAFSVTEGTYLGAQNVEITCATDGAMIYYTMGADPADPTSGSTEYTGAIAVSSTTTIKAIAIKGSDESTVASATYTIVTLEHAGTVDDPYTVADARTAIDAGVGITNVYAKGIVSEIVEAYNSIYGNISYNISTDGETTSDQLQAFRGKNKDGEWFTSENDVKVGDEVIVYGNLKKYGETTYEFDKDNQRYSFTRPGDPVLLSIAISEDPTKTTYDVGDVFDVTGLVVTGTYDQGDPAAIASGITWEVRTNSTSEAVALGSYTLALNQTALQVRATVSAIASEWYDVTGLTVKEHEITPGKYEILLNNALWGSELTGSLSGDNLKDYSGSQNDISFAYNKGTGSNMYFNAAQTRLYNGNELVVTAPTGYVIEKVEGLVATVQANAGTITDNVWTGNVNSVTFSHKNSTGNSQLGTISVTFAEYVPATVATPVISPAAGIFTSAQNVTITCETDGATIYYTTDGTDPDNTSTPYSSAITVDESMTIKAIAYKDAEYSEVATAAYTINIVVVETPVATDSKWVAATEVVDGMQVLIVGANGDDVYAMGIQNNNNRAAVQGSIDGDVFTPGENTMAFTVVEQPDGTFALQTSNDKYLYAASSSSNYLRSKDELDDNGRWTLTIDGAIANGTNTRNTMQFNSGSSCFACYGSASQKPIALYVEQQQTPEPQYTDIRTGLSAGNYYTVCWPKAMTAIQGGTLWSFAGKDASTAYLVQEEAPFVAGRPYIIYAESDKLEAVLEGDDVAAENYNGLYGTMVNLSNSELITAGATHMLKGNELRPIGEGYLNANRAYIVLSEISGGAPEFAPGRNIRKMPLQQEVVTGIDALNASEAPVKMMIDGQLFILRGEKMYNANGQLVK